MIEEEKHTFESQLLQETLVNNRGVRMSAEQERQESEAREYENRVFVRIEIRQVKQGDETFRIAHFEKIKSLAHFDLDRRNKSN